MGGSSLPRQPSGLHRALLAEARSLARYARERVPGPRAGANPDRGRPIPRGEKAGSRSSQGFVFIVFGTPARVSQSHQAPNEAPRRLAVGDTARPVGFVEGTETTHMWTYDRERTPKLLEALSVPTLTVSFVVEPNRNKDELQNPGRVNEYREKLARSTIVNPDLVPTGAALPAAAAPALRAAVQPLSAAIRVLLEKAPPVGTLEDERQPVFGSAVLWGTRATPETMTWIFLPGKDSGESRKLTLHALIRPEGEARTSSRAPSQPRFRTSCLSRGPDGSSSAGSTFRRATTPPRSP